MANNAPAQAEEPGYPGFSGLSILRTVWKRKIRILVAWVLFTVCAVAVVRLLPSVYLAEAVVLIDSQKIPEKFVSATVASDLEERTASIRQMLLSGAELKKVIEEFGLYREERKTRFEEEVLEMMRKDISITVDSSGLIGEKKSNTKRLGAFRVGFQGRDPVLVMRVANRLTDLYVEQNLKTREGQAAGTSEFLDTQLREAKKRLDEMEAAVSKYKLEHNGELPQQENSLASALSRLQIELEANRDAINRAQQTRVVLESSLNATEAIMAAQTRAWEQALHPAAANESPLLPGAPVMPREKKASEVLEEQMEILRGRYKDSHPDVIRMRTDIEKLKHAEERRQAANAAVAPANMTPPGGTTRTQPAASTLREPPEFARTREQVAALKAQLMGSDKELESRKAEQQRILRDLDAYQRRLERLPVREQEMAQITRDYEISKENYKSLLDKKMAAEMALDMERRQQSERFVVLDRAQVPEKPIKPKRPLLYAAGSAVGLLLGLLLGFAAELRRNVLLGEWELPEGTPVLVRLPYFEVPIHSGEMKAKSRGWFGRRKELADASVTLALLAGPATTVLYSHVGRL